MQQVNCPGGGSLTFGFNNFDTTKVQTYIIELFRGGNCTINWPVWVAFPNGIAPVLSSGKDMLLLVADGNSGYYVMLIGSDLKAL